MLTTHSLTCEYFTNPIGLDFPHPRLSWKTNATQRGARQTAYQIQVSEKPDMTASGEAVWDTGKVASDAAVNLPYRGAALRPGQRCYWRVRVWDENDTASEWSEAAFWEMGLMDSKNWRAEWITPDWDEDTGKSQPAPMLRRSFEAKGSIAAARIYATCLGLYELRLNGQRAGDALLTPGWTSYHHQIQYQTYDVTDMLREGENVIGAILGDGWYRGYLGFAGRRNTYGDRLALLLQLQITYDDGRVEVIGSDTEWRASQQGPIRMNDIYMGETYDARLEQPGWDAPGYDAGEWSGVRKYDHTKDTIIAQIAPPVIKHEHLRPVQIIHSPKGETIFDFAQNMVGWVQVRAKGPAGTTITLRHGEVLDQQGNLYTENLRSAKQITQYTLKGGDNAEEVFEPRFTFQGFQYVAVEGYPGEPTLDSLTGIVVHSDIPPTGSFECSNPLINQLQHNIIWGQKGNFVDVPTDCPQRDERLGWTGDAQVFIRTACFNMNVAAFFTKWLLDLSADQFPDGSVPFVVPDVLSGSSGGFFGQRSAGSAAWGDAATVCPWTIYLCYGDTRILEQQYPSMEGWVNYMHSQADDDYIWRKGFHFGDWLDYRGPMSLSPSPVTNKELIATAFFAYGADLLVQAARVLGKTADVEKYSDLAGKVKAAFNDEFVTAGGRVGPNSQTAYVLALHFDLLPESERPKAAERLAEEIRQANYHLTTGFVGASYLCPVLSRFGYTDLAYELLNQESFPSWLYPVKKGATTIWERWDGIKPDGSFQDVGMNSFNHYAYGAIGAWMYRTITGLDVDPDQPGYKHIIVRPQPGGGLTHARATLDSPYGPLASSWELSEDAFHLSVTVPPNSHATVYLPAQSLDAVTEGGKPVTNGNGIASTRVEGDVAIIEVGSGTYDFVTTALNRAKAMEGVRHVAGRLDRYSSLRDLLENDAAKAALTQTLGEEFLQGQQRGFVMDMPLAQVANFAPQILPPEKLDAIEAALGGASQ